MNILINKCMYIFLCITIITSISIYLTNIHHYSTVINTHTNDQSNKKILTYNTNKNKYSSINNNCNHNINCTNLNYIYTRGNNNKI